MKQDLILLGKPGSGKGTQAKILTTKDDYVQISTGDLLRAEVKKGTALGKEIDALIKNGKYASDELAIQLIRNNFKPEKAQIFDGFPRTLVQAQMLDLEILGQRPHLAVHFKIEDQELVTRIIARRSCGQCGRIYNLITLPPKQETKCDDCQTALTHRSDDKAEVVQTRLEQYNKTFDPILQFYKDKGVLQELDASTSPEEVAKALPFIVNLEKKEI